ncbi:hypothetical protein K3495_g10305, partial [Podosphaera aphanis]
MEILHLHRTRQLSPSITINGIVRDANPTPNTTDEAWQEIWTKHRRAVLVWKNHETKARNIVLERLSEKLWPKDQVTLSAKALYDSAANTRRESASGNYIDAIREFHAVKLDSTIDAYIDRFQTAYQNVNTTAEAISATDTTPIDRSIPEATAAAFFLVGTQHVPWLNSWRDNRAIDSTDKPISLQSMMSTLRTVAANNHQTAHNFASAASAASAAPTSRTHAPEARCRKCLHLHKNKHCFKQHPELATGEKGERWKEGMRKKAEKRYQRDVKGKGKAVAGQDDESDYDSEEMNDYLDQLLETNQRNDAGITASASTSSSNKIPIIYDTGASHHFMPVKSMFSKIHKRSKPFRFDQAVGASSLTEQGTALIKLGCHNLYLHECLYSPGSASGIISAGRLKRIADIQPDYSTNVLIRQVNGYPDQPIARLALINDVYYIRPLLKHQHDQSRTIAAPGVARIPTRSSAQRWHQRLGHISKHILKKTITHSVGLEGVETAELNTCETCHLSKAQRFVSRESRITPNEPLDEIFVDTVGKLPLSTDEKQYAVVITDAKTRMRWVLNTNTKDQIADALVQWIKAMHHQYDKRVRAIFRDGGSEFSKTKIFCEQNGIRTDTSSPYTPEQNGTSEAANKVVLRLTRSVLIDAKMPPCYWSWAIQYACFILNRLYCIRTKKVPITDFLQGLRQPHLEKVDLRNLPRFGCQAYKLIQPKPSKFEPRAEKGWFMGFQANTSKNFLILHPHKTPVQGWKWVVSFTPHATFNEDIVFGDNMSSTNKQQTFSYWANDLPPNPHSNPTSSIINPPQSHNSSPQSDSLNQPQTHSPSATCQPTSAPQTVTSRQSQDNQSAFNIPSHITLTHPDVQLQDPNSPPSDTPPIPPSTWRDSSLNQLSSTLTNPDPSEESDHDIQHGIQISQNDNDSDNGAEDQTIPHEAQTNHSSLPSESESPRLDHIMTGWDPIPPIAGQKRAHSPEPNVTNRKRDTDNVYGDTGNADNNVNNNKTSIIPLPDDLRESMPDDDNYDPPDDRIMTGWDPVRPLAGQKRNHSPEGDTMLTKRGRRVKRINYNSLHHGLSANETKDPQSWEEAMTSQEARQWRIAANEEFQSLLKTGTIKIISEKAIPQG